MKKKDEILLAEAYQQIVEGMGRFSVVKKGQEVQPRGEDEWGDDNKISSYDIMENGEKIGELEHASYTGFTSGHLYNKELPDISRYGRDPLSCLHGFMKSNTGAKWMANIEKYKSLPGPVNDYRLKQ
jgi:hypothetical protein